MEDEQIPAPSSRSEVLAPNPLLAFALQWVLGGKPAGA